MTATGTRRLFTIALVGLVLQYVAVGVADLAGRTEPWPAIVMPGFKGVWDAQTQFDVPEASLYVSFADGSTEQAYVGEVFQPIPASHHLGILRRQFMPSRMSGTERTEQGRHPATRPWLTARLEDIFDDRRSEQMDVVWYRTHYSPRGEFLGRTAVDTLRIPLAE